jgi:non-heme chloroperoxidase
VPTVTANDLSFFYEDKGSGDPIIFCHGTMSDYRVWKSPADSLSSNYRTIAYSRRHAKPNSNPGSIMDSTIENNAADLRALIVKLGVSPVHLVGHSWGGFTAAYFACHYPDMLKSLTLNNAAIAPLILSNPKSPAQMISLLLRSPSVAFSARHLVNESNAALAANDSGDARRASQLFYSGIFDKGTPLPSLDPVYTQMMIDNAGTLKETTTDFPILTPNLLNKIKTPTLVIRGINSAKWDCKVSETAAASIPNSESAIVSKSGHFPMIENPGEYTQKLSEFLQKHG